MDLGDRIDALERGFAPLRAFARWAVGGAAVSVVAVCTALYQRGAAEQRVLDRIEQLERAVERLESQMQQLNPPPPHSGLDVHR